MIWESSYWKNDLLKQAKSIHKKVLQKRWTEATFARLEQSIMLGFYTIRKLAEAKKMSEDLMEQQIQLISYAWLRKQVTKMNWTHYWELYDIENGKSISRNLRFMCNQIVHSYVFITVFNEAKELEAILVTSDRDRNEVLYQINIKQIIDLFEFFGNYYPDEMRMVYDQKKQDFDVTYSS